MQLDAQQPNCLPARQPWCGGVISFQVHVDQQLAWVGRADEALRAFEEGCPRPAVGIHTARHHERQLLIERAMLVWHEVANDLLPEHLHALRHTDLFLQDLLTAVPR